LSIGLGRPSSADNVRPGHQPGEASGDPDRSGDDIARPLSLVGPGAMRPLFAATHAAGVVTQALRAPSDQRDWLLQQEARKPTAVGDTLALSPPLIVSEAQIGEIFDKVGKIIRQVA